MQAVIVALRNEKGSYNSPFGGGYFFVLPIVALRNEKGSYNCSLLNPLTLVIVALRNEKGSYNRNDWLPQITLIVALRNEGELQLKVVSFQTA